MTFVQHSFSYFNADNVTLQKFTLELNTSDTFGAVSHLEDQLTRPLLTGPITLYADSTQQHPDRSAVFGIRFRTTNQVKV